MQKRIFDLSSLSWHVAGYDPHVWRRDACTEIGASLQADVAAVPARVPGSVQRALRDAGILPDWNIGLNARQCEWVENRHWIFETVVPNDWFEPGRRFRLRCLGLDYAGWVLWNGVEILAFRNSHVPHAVEVAPDLRRDGQSLKIVFDCPPRWLGQFGFTSRMTDWKPRFNYRWDWTCRLVQTGVWDGVRLECVGEGEILRASVRTDYDTGTRRGALTARGSAAGPADARIRAVLSRGATILRREVVALGEFERNGIDWTDLEVDPWWPNGLGAQELYRLTLELLDGDRHALDIRERNAGFRRLTWQPCRGAAPGADPWVCSVNGVPLFLQGVNWTPIRPNFADLDPDDYRRRVELYRDLGVNLFRVWGGGFLEREWFYDLCDEHGILVWQEFPLSSSGIENRPPTDPAAVDELETIARAYVERRASHVSLALWCGGNELSRDEGPVGIEEPVLARFRDVVAELDPGRRFLATSPTGPRFSFDPAEAGKGLHWNVHGPWKAEGDLAGGWSALWAADDALFHAETGAPGPSSADLIRRTRGEFPETPGTLDNPLWRRFPWWSEWEEFVRQHGRDPADLDEYVQWGQARQAEALRIAATTCKRRFPACGGIVIWMGHDSYPCTANTSIVDFDGCPKPAALALAQVFRPPLP